MRPSPRSHAPLRYWSCSSLIMSFDEAWAGWAGAAPRAWETSYGRGENCVRRAGYAQGEDRGAARHLGCRSVLPHEAMLPELLSAAADDRQPPGALGGAGRARSRAHGTQCLPAPGARAQPAALGRHPRHPERAHRPPGRPARLRRNKKIKGAQARVSWPTPRVCSRRCASCRPRSRTGTPRPASSRSWRRAACARSGPTLPSPASVPRPRWLATTSPWNWSGAGTRRASRSSHAGGRS